MSQNDFNIANQGFPSFRSDMNSAFQALASNSAGATEPATTYAYQWWYDSTNEVLKIRNADNDAWIDFAVFDQATDTWSLGSLVVDGNLVVDTDTLFVDSTNNRVGVGTTTPITPFHVNAGTINTAAIFESEDENASIYLIDSTTTGGTSASHGLLTSGDELSARAVDHFIVETGTTERMRVDNVGNLLVGKTAFGATVVGSEMRPNGRFMSTAADDFCFYANRLNSDGVLVTLRQDDSQEGSISVSGTTVSYNGGHLSRWSRLPDGADDSNIFKGTVMTNLNEKIVWDDEKNEQLNYTNLSSIEGDKNVAGVFVAWDESDNWGDYYLAMTGDMIIRIAQGVTVQRGDLLMSAGDGTAKPQGDDIIRSKTIAKVISTEISCTYADGSYCVPCVLMAC